MGKPAALKDTSTHTVEIWKSYTRVQLVLNGLLFQKSRQFLLAFKSQVVHYFNSNLHFCGRFMMMSPV